MPLNKETKPNQKRNVDLLLKTTTLHNTKIKTYPRRSFNISGGVGTSSELSSSSIEEIKHNLKTHVRGKKNNDKKNDQLINTNTYVLTFNISKHPPKLEIRHHESRCTRKRIYKKCGEDCSDHLESTCKQFKCANCNGDHLTDFRLCAA